MSGPGHHDPTQETPLEHLVKQVDYIAFTLYREVLPALDRIEGQVTRTPASRINLRFVTSRGAVHMANAVIHADDNGATATLVVLDKKGNPAVLVGVPAWSLSADGIVAMTVAADGLSASFAPVTVGSVTVNVVAEGDPTPGVDTIHGTGDIQVVAAEAATVTLNFAPNP